MSRSSKHRLYRDVHFISSITPPRNYKNLNSLKRIANYIDSEFRKTSLLVKRQTWEVEDQTYENIIASYRPDLKKRLVIGAHYDVFNESPGADDNGSGVAGILELARLFNTTPPELSYGVDWVTFCLEEPPFFRRKSMGSYIHAKSLFDQGVEVMGMVSFEMIGYFSGRAKNETQPLAEAFVNVVGIQKYKSFNKKVAALLSRNPRMGVRQHHLADDNKNNGPSDHRNYWKFGYPGLMLIGGKEEGNPHYHRDSDTIETLDFDKMRQVVNSSYHLITEF